MVKHKTNKVRQGEPGKELMKKLKKSIDYYAQKAKAEYIGKSSGSNGENAMRSRHDKRKKDWKINTMILLYMSPSSEHVDSVERDLIEHSKTFHGNICKNTKGGGGGKPPHSGEYHYVYGAYRMKKKKKKKKKSTRYGSWQRRK